MFLNSMNPGVHINNIQDSAPLSLPDMVYPHIFHTLIRFFHTGWKHAWMGSEAGPDKPCEVSMTVVREVFLKGGPFQVLYPEVIRMLITGVLCTAPLSLYSKGGRYKGFRPLSVHSWVVPVYIYTRIVFQDILSQGCLSDLPRAGYKDHLLWGYLRENRYRFRCLIYDIYIILKDIG